MQNKVNQILESGASYFENVEQALEEQATVFQISELLETVESLAKRVLLLEQENASLRELVCCGDEKGTKANPIEVVDSNRVPYELAEEVLPTVPPRVLSAVSGQRCRPRIPFASQELYPSLSPDNSATRTISRIRKAQ